MLAIRAGDAPLSAVRADRARVLEQAVRREDERLPDRRA